MPTIGQIQAFTVKAKQAGFSDAQISAEISRKTQEETQKSTIQPTAPVAPTPQAPVATPTPQPEKKSFVRGFVDALVDPAIKYAKYVGEAGYQGGRYIIDPTFRKAVNGGDLTGEEAQKLNAMPDTMFVDKEKIKDRASAITSGLKATAGAAAYAMPGAASFKGAVAAGAAAGALNTASQDNFGKDGFVEGVKDATTGALVGGTIGGAFSIAGKAAGKVMKMVSKPSAAEKNLFEKVGQSLREDATQIRVNPSIYGAKKEKLIQETLDALGIKGGPSEKYSQLEPALKAIGDKIDEIVKANPNDEVLAADVIRLFRTKLQSEVRSKTLTSKVADQEIKGYLTDLFRASTSQADDAAATTTTALAKTDQLAKTNMIDFLKTGSQKIKLDSLVKLKKLANQDYGSIADKLERGTPLTDREKIAFYARETLDDAIVSLQPKIKDLTIMQSHLFDAARPLSAARNTTPTFRVFGITVPKEKVIEDWMGRGLIKLGEAEKKLLEKWVDPVSRTIKSGYESINNADKKLLSDALSKISVIAATNQMPDNGNNENNSVQDNNYSGGKQDNSNYNLKEGTQFDPLNNNADIVAQNDPSAIDQTQQNIPDPFRGMTKQQVLRLAVASGAKKSDLEEIAYYYDIVSEQKGGVISEETRKIAGELRNEYISRTKENGYIQAINGFRKVNTTPASPAGDLSLIFAYMKMLDPTSVVRESEQELAQNATSLPGKLQNYAMQVANGKKLNDAQRQEFRDAAGVLFEQYSATQSQIDNLYSGFASQYGVDPKLLGIGALNVDPVAK